jgi:hypothetical protein
MITTIFTGKRDVALVGVVVELIGPGVEPLVLDETMSLACAVTGRRIEPGAGDEKPATLKTPWLARRPATTLLATGVPRPVTRSYPDVAEYPLNPTVTSWKADEGME